MKSTYHPKDRPIRHPDRVAYYPRGEDACKVPPTTGESPRPEKQREEEHPERSVPQGEGGPSRPFVSPTTTGSPTPGPGGPREDVPGRSPGGGGGHGVPRPSPSQVPTKPVESPTPKGPKREPTEPKEPPEETKVYVHPPKVIASEISTTHPEIFGGEEIGDIGDLSGVYEYGEGFGTVSEEFQWTKAEKWKYGIHVMSSEEWEEEHRARRKKRPVVSPSPGQLHRPARATIESEPLERPGEMGEAAYGSTVAQEPLEQCKHCACRRADPCVKPPKHRPLPKTCICQCSEGGGGGGGGGDESSAGGGGGGASICFGGGGGGGGGIHQGFGEGGGDSTGGGGSGGITTSAKKGETGTGAAGGGGGARGKERALDNT